MSIVIGTADYPVGTKALAVGTTGTVVGLVVAPYAGQSQQQKIPVPAKTAYQGWDGEEGPWVMLPYAQIFDYNSQADAQGQAWVPPPVSQTDIWSAQQTFPL